jgi:DnaA-homolog protein
MLQLPLDILLDDSAKFDNFYAASNQQLVSQLQLLAQVSNFIYISGLEQTGKTHLAQAVCHLCDESNLSAVYLPLSNPNLSPDILIGMSHVDIVVIDDLEAIFEGPNQMNWEKALFDLYNQLKQADKSLVIFSQILPTDHQELESIDLITIDLNSNNLNQHNKLNMAFKLADLKSRLNAMEIYQLLQLDDQQKSAFFIQRAANRGLEISQEVAQFILARQSRSMIDLINLLEQLDRSSIALKRKVTIPLVKQLFNL